MYYIVYVMEAAGIGDPLLTASIQYILNVALTLPAILFLDKWGRRPSLLLGSFGMMTLLFIVGALEASYGRSQFTDSGPLAAITWVVDGNQSVSKAIVALSYLFVCTFAVTWVKIPSPPPKPTPLFPSPSLCNGKADKYYPTRAPHPGPTPRRSSPPKSAPKPSRSRPPPTGPGTARWPSPCRLSSGASTGSST